jgi:hypothetical protein
MKLNELIKDFTIYVNNEEKRVLESLNGLVPISGFDERDQVIINNLLRKSVISKVLYNNNIMVMKNDV